MIAEAGLSVGAVYRYFKSKEELITAIAGQVVDEVTGAIAATDQAQPLDGVMRRLLDDVEPRLGPEGIFRLALQVWSESLRTPRADPEAVGAVLFSMLRGYLLQRTLTGKPDRETFLNGVTALLAEN